MKNIYEESAEIPTPDLKYQVECLMNRIEHERTKLRTCIDEFETACIMAGFKIAQIKYRRKNDKDEWGQERWYKWDSRLKK